MSDFTTYRLRYTQIFVICVLASFLYMLSVSLSGKLASFDENLPGRNLLIASFTRLRLKIGDRVFNQALIGKDGWMEWTGLARNLDDFQNLFLLKNKKDIEKELITLNQYLKSQGITLLIVVAPNKATIYPDKLPEQIKSLPTRSRLDRLISYLEDNNLPVIVDLRPALRAARQNHDVYYKTDTHWNGYGAFAAYTTIINTLGSSYPELKPYETADLELVTTEPGTRDIPKLIQADFITEPLVFFKPKKPFVQTLYPGNYDGYYQFSWIPDSKLPTLLMIHDSFGNRNLNDYLSMNFGKSHYFIHQLGMYKYFTKESIQQFKPDVIIIEIVERNLDQLADILSNIASE